MHGACTAQSHATTVFRAGQADGVAEHPEQRSFRTYIYFAGLTIHDKPSRRHEEISPRWRCIRQKGRKEVSTGCDGDATAQGIVQAAGDTMQNGVGAGFALSMKWRSLDESALQTEMRSLREIYAERKELIAKYVPADIQVVHACAVEELKQSGIASRALQSGADAPSFELPDQNGNVVRSADLLAGGRLVICFIRGRWCPFCVGQMQTMDAVVPKLKELKASLVAISPQTMHQSYLMSDQHHLQFPLLSDTENNVARQFGLVYRVPEYQQDVYRRVFVNLPFLNGGESWELPIPAVYILGQSGSGAVSVLYAKADPDYMERPEPSEIMEFLSKMSR